MKIYTKTGDEGETSLFGGKRVSKADIRIDSYGTIDELNAYIGLVRDQDVNKARLDFLVDIQDKLFIIGSMLAADPANTKIRVPHVTHADTELLETEIDAMEERLQPLRFFVLPGGHTSVSFCHVARTVCRRAERLVISLNEHEKIEPLIIRYLNRLSDYLFVLSRTMANELGVEERPWNSANR
jgi:cob(I)alamin adenosyltransferase